MSYALVHDQNLMWEVFQLLTHDVDIWQRPEILEMYLDALSKDGVLLHIPTLSSLVQAAQTCKLVLTDDRKVSNG